LNLSLERVRMPSSYPLERVVEGELQLLRRRLDLVLEEVGRLAASGEPAWLRVEETSRIARRAMLAALGAVPALSSADVARELEVGSLRVDTVARRQWYLQREVVLTPLEHRLLAVMAADPARVFAKDELAQLVWRDAAAALNAVRLAVGRVRTALVAAGAPRGTYLVSSYGVGWSLSA
jgi:DNA-binding response OmpR family regulator